MCERMVVPLQAPGSTRVPGPASKAGSTALVEITGHQSQSRDVRRKARASLCVVVVGSDRSKLVGCLPPSSFHRSKPVEASKRP